jgi:signal transduction histidine kinase
MHSTTDATPERRSRRRAFAEPVQDHEIVLLHALSDAARQMHRSLSLDEVVGVATERAREIVDATWAVTSQATNEDWANAITTTSVKTPTTPPAPALALVPPGGLSVAVDVCRGNRALRLSRVEIPSPDARSADVADKARPTVVGWMAAPLVGSDGRNLGLIQLAREDADFTPSDEAILVQLAGMASVAIENARLYEAAVHARTQLAWAAHIERVRAAELRAVIEAMGEAVLVFDANGRVSLVNPAADALFAGRPVITYDDLLSRLHTDAGARVPVDVAGPTEVRVVDDRDRWLELRLYPVRGGARRPGESDDDEGRIAVMRDISSSRRARAQREAFLGILSHELRTPITTIYAGSKVLARDEPLEAPTRRELAADISGEAERLFRLVEDLLVMTRVERGVLQLANEPVLLQRVLAGAIRLEAAHWPRTRIELTGPTDLPAVSGDATYVEQVTRNLLSNAAKYSPPGTPVEVRLEESDNEVVVRVLDRGRGFQSHESDDLFELFYRSPATAAQASGAGIGLFVCRRLINAMRGRIWARPRPGGGAEFGFALPLYAETDTE